MLKQTVGVSLPPPTKHNDTVFRGTVHHVFKESYCADEAKQALRRLPAIPPCNEAMGEEDSWPTALLRPAVRPRWSAQEVRRSEGRPALRENAAAGVNGCHGQGTCERIPLPQGTEA